MERDTIKFANPGARKKFLNKWFNFLIKQSAFKVKETDLKDSKDWFIDKGVIKHRSGKFFQVVGLEWLDLSGNLKKQPFLAQREIGVLGFILRYKNKVPELLIQAKIEPGNVGMVQIAPTCQATESNASRVHGGDWPPYIRYFSVENPEIIYDKRQSEQGTRFYKKLNRNVLILVKKKIPLKLSHKWIALKDLLYFLHINYLVNTDARSVLVCSPWHLLTNKLPFSHNKTGFGVELAKSYVSCKNFINLDVLKSEIKLKRLKFKRPKIITLPELSDWHFNKRGVWPIKRRSFFVKQIKVRISSREISDWDQPIIESVGIGRIILLCGRHKGILHFLFQSSAEPGLYHKVELTPTIVIEPGGQSQKINKKLSGGKIIVDCFQSEEGGRFFKDKNHFQIIDRGEIFLPPPNFYWLTLKQIRQLLDDEGWFTNEARSAISMLLYWL